MSDRIQLDIKGKKIEVWFSVEDGKEASCHYCGKQGFAQIVKVGMMYTEAQWLSENSELYAFAEEETKRKLNHGRAVCWSTYWEPSICRKLYIHDRTRGEKINA